MTDNPQEKQSAPEKPVSDGDVLSEAPTQRIPEPVSPPVSDQGLPPTGKLPVEHSSESSSGSRRRGVPGVVVVAFLVGAFVGGVSGAGVGALSQSRNSQPAGSTGAAMVTVNNAGSVTPITGAVAKASASIVTISIENGPTAAGMGSGIVLSADGYVLTNAHVVTSDGHVSEPTIRVTSSSGQIMKAKSVGVDPIADLAVIKVNDGAGMTPASFADSSKVNVGDKAIAIGSPLRLPGTVTDGIVSALNRSITVASSAAPATPETPGGGGRNGQQGPFENWKFDIPGQKKLSPQGKAEATIALQVIQTDAAINPGNSGGALLNANGEVIGVNVAIAGASDSSSSNPGGNIGIGFAITSNVAERVAKEIIATGKASHGLFGAIVDNAAAVSDSKTVGCLIKSVVADGAAGAAGLQPGDIVTQFDGVPVSSREDLIANVRSLRGGAQAKVQFVRGGEVKSAEVTLGELTT